MTTTCSRRSLLTAAAGLGAAALGLPLPTLGQGFPDKTKPIIGIVPSPVGTSVDTVARAYAQAMREIVGTNVVIDTRPGAEGVIGLQAAKSASPDGYTLLFTSLSTQVVNPHVFKHMAVNPQTDFIPLAGTMKSGLIMAVGPSVQYKTAQDFLAAAKANPGKYTYGSTSSTTRVAGHMIARSVGADLMNVPYKNFSELMTNVIAGQIDMVVFDVATLQPFFSRGLRVLAATTSTRLPTLPDVPTLAESGVPGIEITIWHGAYAPANTPAATVDILANALRRSVASKYVTDHLNTFGLMPLELSGSEFAAFERAEFAKWGKAVNDAGLAGTM